MKISRYGVVLNKLTKNQLELVRKWRNADEIKQFMEYRAFITPEMQSKWFESLNEFCDFYFIIEYNNQQIGLIHTSNIDWEKKTANSGLFVWDNNYLNTHIPVLASLAMLDAFFLLFKIEKIYAKVLQTNIPAIRYNSTIGFKPVEPIEEKEFQLYCLSQQNYFSTTKQLKESAKRVGGEEFVICLKKDSKEQLIEITGLTLPTYSEVEYRIELI